MKLYFFIGLNSMKRNKSFYIRAFAILFFAVLFSQTILQVDAFQNLNNMVNSQGVVITSPANIPMVTSQVLADPAVAQAATNAASNANAGSPANIPIVTSEVLANPAVAQATTNATALAARMNIVPSESTSTTNTQTTPLTNDSSITSTTTYILIGVIVLGAVACGVMLMHK